MKRKRYVPEEVEQIQMALLALVCYAKRHDSRELPHCFQFCNRIVRNIDICRANQYEGLDELSELIQREWRCAMENHAGLPEYYIPNSDFKVQSSMAHAMGRQVSAVDHLIFP